MMGYLIEITSDNKHDAAIEFREKILIEYEKWFSGSIPSLYGTPNPNEDEKEELGSLRENAILTWAKMHQERMYLEMLRAPPEIFAGMRVLDIGSGGIPSGLCFTECEIYCLDPLIPTFQELDYPFHFYEHRATFVQGKAEHIPFPSCHFDAVISVNALDHVDNISKTALEIQRVLKKDGLLRLSVNYHQPTILEPIELCDDVIEQHFVWCGDFHKIAEWDNGTTSNEPLVETYALWSNF